ncbi:MAG: hypothetical protein C4589_07305 [Peptococcaceae bacterium]|jgi:hypothetical protein|nr:MAG: hypothetical protein C4589_07305 [Peptococcaceae bacterium]
MDFLAHLAEGLKATFVHEEFYRLVAASFVGVFCGYFLSLQLQKKLEKKASRQQKGLYLFSLKTELDLNSDILNRLAMLTGENTEQTESFYDLENLKAFYSILFRMVKELKMVTFEGMLKSGLLGAILSAEQAGAVVSTYREIEKVVLESESSFAWLNRGRHESAEAWQSRKKGIIAFLHNQIKAASEQTAGSVSLIEKELEKYKALIGNYKAYQPEVKVISS